MGSAVDKANLTRELTVMAEAGFGGVEITPIYGVKGREEEYVPFLSSEYVDLLRHACSEAKRLGMKVDMATGTGWPFGGPHVTSAEAELKARVKDGRLEVMPSKFKVKRAAPGGEGLVISPFSTKAMEHYLQPFTKALGALEPGALHGQFHDSFEYEATWALEMPARFHAMHGYHLEEALAAISEGKDQDRLARLKSDYRETLAALHQECMAVWIDWCHARGQQTRNQAHGAPANLLDLYAQVDVPETEIFGSTFYSIPGYRYESIDAPPYKLHPLINHFASSAGHVAGRHRISSETFTWVREHFHEAPSEMKPHLDELFTIGINHVFYHGTAYSPADATWPGWLFYASSQINPRNPLWPTMGSFNRYVARCQAVLQAGCPDQDLLIYWPFFDLLHDPRGWNKNLSIGGGGWFLGSAFEQLARVLKDAGYQYDYVSDRQLQSLEVANGALKAPGGTYRALLIPTTTNMPVATLRHLVTLARQGAQVVVQGDLPQDVPGLGHLEKRREEFRKIQAEIGPVHDGQRVLAGGGSIRVGTDVPALLTQAKVAPEPAVPLGLSLIRRVIDGETWYFVVNLTSKPIEGWVPFQRKGVAVVIMDPLTSRSGRAAWRDESGAAQVFLHVSPGVSLFLRMTRPGAALPDTHWPYVIGEGTPMAVVGDWSLRFTEGGPTLPSPRRLTELVSWTTQDDATAFGGTAVYETTVNIPGSINAQDWLLDLGDVRESARVWVNDAEVGWLWSLPFQVRLGAAVKPGRNTLRIEVANLAANRIRAMDIAKQPWKNFSDINVVTVRYKPLDATQWSLRLSGLLGPVSLTPLRIDASGQPPSPLLR